MIWSLIASIAQFILGKIKWFMVGYEMGAYKTQELKAKAELAEIEKKGDEIEIKIRKDNSLKSSLDLARDTFEHGPSSGDLPGRGSGE